MEIIQLSLFTGKVCSKCQTWKPYIDFRKRKEVPDGYRRVCKLCQDEGDDIRQARYGHVATEKKCPGCSQLLPSESFDRNKVSKNGLSNYCKVCKKKQRPAHVHTQAIGKKCPVCKTKKPAKEFGHCSANADGLQSKCKKCKQAQNARVPTPATKRCPVCKQMKPSGEYSRNRAHSGGLAAQCKDCEVHGKASIEKRRANYNRYIARKKSVGGAYTAKQWKAICDYYGNKCLRCGTQGALSVDHVISLLHGGSNNVDNLQPLCRACNSSKAAADMDYRPDGGAFCRSLL